MKSLDIDVRLFYGKKNSKNDISTNQKAGK